MPAKARSSVKATAETPAEAPVKGVEAKPLVLVVTGPRKGRWRAGMYFTDEPVTLRVDALSKRAIAALSADPVLTILTREAD